MLVTGIIGYPLKTTFSPPMHNAAFKKLGLDGVYVQLPVKEEKLKEAVYGLPALGFRGFNVRRPALLGVSSPKIVAIKAWEHSWKEIAKRIGGKTTAIVTINSA